VSAVVYSVPLQHLAAFRGRDLVVRGESAVALVEHLDSDTLERVAYVRLESLPPDTECLTNWAEGMPVELCLTDPGAQFAQLYRYAKLLDNHPMRVSVPALPGFEKAVKVALSLQFAVKLEVGQPDVGTVVTLAQVLGDYLHQPTVTQPVEYFHTLLLSWFQDPPLNLWGIQEEDPALIRYIDDSGTERLAGKLARYNAGIDSAGFVESWATELRSADAECADCAFFAHCRGYYKWPQRDYDCAGVKTLFDTVQQAAEDLQHDLAAARAAGGETRS